MTSTTPQSERLRQLAPWLDEPQSIRCILFDVGFTMLKPEPATPEIIRRICAEHGIAIALEDLEAQYPNAEAYFFKVDHLANRTWADNERIDHNYRGYFTEFLRPFLHSPKLEEMAEIILREFDTHHVWGVFPDVRPTLDRLKGRYTLGVISDWGINLGRILRNHGLLPYFDLMLVSATSRRAKPDQHLFETALQRANALGMYTLYIGDNYILDILGARSAGINPILIDRAGLHAQADLDCPVIPSIATLISLLGLEDDR